MSQQEGAAKTPPAAANTTSEEAAAALARSVAASEALRQRADRGAKVLAGGGTTLVTAVGLSKFSDIFPSPPGEPGWATLGVIAGFGTMILAVLLIAYRFWKLAEPVPFRSDHEKMELRDGEWEDLVQPIYDETAELNGVASLAAYEARALRFESVAPWLPDTQATEVLSESDGIQAEVLATLARARVRVLRRRTARSVTHLALLWYLLFAAGVVVFGVGADWLQAERTDAVTIQKACADARAVDTVIEAELPAICGTLPETDGGAVTTDEEIQKANVALATALKDCEKAAASDTTACSQIRAAIAALAA